jgi:photosystem II stability/assembly factor-like uncharacterized protein
MSGRVTAIDVVNSQPDHIYIGTASGGVWESFSGGTTWQPIAEKMPTQAIGALKINQRNPAEIWVGTGEGNPRNSHNSGEGIFKSIDGGKTWKCMGLQGTKAIHRIIIHRDNPDVVLVAALGSAWGASDERGIYKTTDGGKTWRKVLYVNDITGAADLVVDATNPNKMFASMWEFGRKPWIFNSGGKGSGLYASFDGGETWERRVEKDGLPKGELGRIGLAISPSKPNNVYAIVEAKENAFYRSTDGGYKWSKVADKGFGDRPFYYSEIYVDPKNENRVYSIFTTINRSEDGGKNWSSFAGWIIHPDHHAFWISPDNPDYLINGNDGGLNITRDGGKSWQFVDNLPLGQFYHVAIDNDAPFNVYGGLQDNGSWVGPSSVWRQGGIRNQDWKEVYFGDGFDVLPRPSNNRYVYAMSQGGSLGYVDTKTGFTNYIKPQSTDNQKFRFNWNAGLAQNPFHDCGIYYGSQFVHKSLDCGKSWEIISPDLTTNDTLKQKSDKSGGLTPDVTAAENHCTILCIAPSPIDENVIWVGTDDGNIQVTRDGGKTWTNTIENIKGLPKGAWIPQIEVNKRNAGEAFVVVNNYRLNDWKPYIYHTTDYGKKWKRIANEDNMKGHALCIVQDPTEPNLLFAGTDAGLWVSIDMGETWSHFKENFPQVNVMDLKISKEGDLVIATFGRAIWVLDDIAPLRDLAKNKAKALEKPFAIFAAPDAYLAEYRSYEGSRFNANALFEAESKPTSAVFQVWIKELIEKSKDAKVDNEKQKEENGKSKEKEDKEKEKQLIINVLNEKGDTIRTMKQEIDTFLYKVRWGLTKKGTRMPSREETKPDAGEPNGTSVIPGRYKVFANYGKHKDSTFVNVLQDPRLNISMADLKAKDAAFDDLGKLSSSLATAADRLREIEKTIQLVESQIVNVPDSSKKEVKTLAKNMKDSIGNLQLKIFGPKEPGKGINRSEDHLTSKIWGARWFIESCEGAPSPNAMIPFNVLKKDIGQTIDKVNILIDKDLPTFQAKAEAVKYSLFKKVEKVKMD